MPEPAPSPSKRWLIPWPSLALGARGALGALIPEGPLDLRILGRTLLHAALVGALAGVVGVLFLSGLELCQTLLLEAGAGYVPLRAAGERPFIEVSHPRFRPYLLILLPALGALLSGLLTAWFAPEAQGGGGDAAIDAFHRHGGQLRPRLLWVKPLASLLTLGTGGAGGREGPTMQIGGAIGSLVARTLRLSVRERRLLLVVGIAAGIAAVFRTPLGAALLAVEILYRDDFEADALVPAVLASVVSYSVATAVLGESTLLRTAPRYPFVPAHLPLYGLLALLVALLASAFVATLRAVQGAAARARLPLWARPAAGGLLLGLFCTPIIVFTSQRIGIPGQGLGLLGGGYGVVQLAITGFPWMPDGWAEVRLLLLLCAAKLVASSLTIGSGGSAGDFAPSLVLGGLLGGAFGRAALLLLGDPRIDPGAFALVGMGAFYGGIAHVPLSALILVCELAGSYDLLVPLMLAEGVAFVALRGKALYRAQVPTRRDSPAHRDRFVLDVLGSVLVRDVMVSDRPFASFTPHTRAEDMIRRLGESSWQDTFPVLGAGGALLGIVTAEGLRVLALERDTLRWTLAADVMQAPVTVRPDDDLRKAIQAMLALETRELPVVDKDGKIVGFLDEAEVARAYLSATVQGSSVEG